MKKNHILTTVLVWLVISGFSQTSLQQVLVGSGGAFGNPDDHVIVSAYDPLTQISSAFGEVSRESMQDMVIAGQSVFITAEDSIVKFNLATHQKEMSIYEPNLNRLFAWGDYLMVSRRSDINGSPADSIYLKVYHKADFSWVASVHGISSDAAALAMVQDTLYLAVSGDWTATEGHLAVIETTNWQLVREINLGTDAVGINDLYVNNDFIYTVNKTPYLGTNGSVTTYSVLDASFSTSGVSHVLGRGVALNGNTLFLGVDNGIGSYDVSNGQMIETTIVPDPGSAFFIYISAAAYDSISQLFYVATTDYFSMGEGKIFDLSGTETGSFEAGISTESIVLDYQSPNGIEPSTSKTYVEVYPNPAKNYVVIATSENILMAQGFDAMGNEVTDRISTEINRINLSGLKAGFYLLKVRTDKGIEVHQIVKQ